MFLSSEHYDTSLQCCPTQRPAVWLCMETDGGSTHADIQTLCNGLTNIYFSLNCVTALNPATPKVWHQQTHPTCVHSSSFSLWGWRCWVWKRPSVSQWKTKDGGFFCFLGGGTCLLFSTERNTYSSPSVVFVRLSLLCIHSFFPCIILCSISVSLSAQQKRTVARRKSWEHNLTFISRHFWVCAVFVFFFAAGETFKSKWNLTREEEWRKQRSVWNFWTKKK